MAKTGPKRKTDAELARIQSSARGRRERESKAKAKENARKKPDFVDPLQEILDRFRRDF